MTPYRTVTYRLPRHAWPAWAWTLLCLLAVGVVMVPFGCVVSFAEFGALRVPPWSWLLPSILIYGMLVVALLKRHSP